MTEFGFIGRCGRGSLFFAQLATIAGLPAYSYDAETKTLTALADGALVIDGGSPLVGLPVLVKDEDDGERNGVYYPLQVGGVSARWVLRRAFGFDSSHDARAGCLAVVLGGSQEDTWFMLEPDRNRVLDTDELDFETIAIGGGGGISTYAALVALVAGADTAIGFNGQKITGLGAPTPGSTNAATALYAETVATAAGAAATAASNGYADGVAAAAQSGAVTTANAYTDAQIAATNPASTTATNPALANAGTLTADVSLTNSHFAEVVGRVLVVDANDALLYTKSLKAIAARNNAGVTAGLRSDIIDDQFFDVAGHAFAVALNGNDVRFTYTNTTGGAVSVSITTGRTQLPAP